MKKQTVSTDPFLRALEGIINNYKPERKKSQKGTSKKVYPTRTLSVGEFDEVVFGGILGLCGVNATLTKRKQLK